MIEVEVQVVNHPLIQHKLTLLRDKHTGSKEFRELVGEIAMLMCYEATRDLPLKEVEVETPVSVAQHQGDCRSEAGLCTDFARGAGYGRRRAQSCCPPPRVGHIGLYRDPETLKPVEYYCKLPGDIPERDVIVLDPMLATGGSAIDAVSQIKKPAIRAALNSCASSRRPRGSRLSARPILTCRCTLPRWMKSSTSIPTSCLVWAMPAIASSARNKGQCGRCETRRSLFLLVQPGERCDNRAA